MNSKTLAEVVSRDFSTIKVKGSLVKVPRLKAGKRKARPAKAIRGKTEIPVSSIVAILIKNAVEKAKRERKGKATENAKAYSVKEDKSPVMGGGYGTASKGYGISSQSYVDYGKLFSYLGRFKARGAYQGSEDAHEKPLQLDDKGFFLADQKLMDQGAKYIRYFNSKSPIDKSSLVPMAGMNSGEWEQFKLWMRLDPVMYLLKISTS